MGKDKWEKAESLSKVIGSVLIPVAIFVLGYWGNKYLQERQSLETKRQLYTQLMSRREESESSLRKDMFTSIVKSFIEPGSTTPCLEEKVLDLELLAYNFYDSLNLKPIFKHLKKQIDYEISLANGKIKQIAALGKARNQCEGKSIDTLNDYLDRLNSVAKIITQKQLHVLEQVGTKFDRTIPLEGFANKKQFSEIKLDSGELDLNNNANIQRIFDITVQDADIINKEIKIQVAVSTIENNTKTTQIEEFSIGYFDFPMIDNTRLSNDERYAVVVTGFSEKPEPLAFITLVYFPGSYASLKDKPYYDDVLNRLTPNKP